MSEALIDLAWIVYLIDVLAVEDYHDGFGIMMFFGSVGVLIYTLLPTEETLEDCVDHTETWWFNVQPKIKTLATWLISISILYTVYYTFMPSKETAWTITGIVAASKVAENPDINKITGEGMDILNKKLQIYSKKLDKQLGIESEKGE